jgi:TATA-box binding protein (TBP) (component of TFIID and TFIIIB)
MSQKYKISTITMSLQIPKCNLNLMNIGKYLQIDDNIIGIKYNFGKSSILKGKYSTSIYKKSKIKNQNKINKTLFYNQVSIIVNLDKSSDKRIINVKLFGNGTIHLTGVKHPSEGKNVMMLLYTKLLELCTQYDTILLTSDVNNVYLDNNNNIYTNNTNRTIIGFKYIGPKNEILYNIFKKDYTIDKNTGLFISQKFESKRTRPLLNFNGEKVGVSRIELLKNKSKLYKNNANVNFDYQNGFIYYDGDGKSNIIGKIVYEYTNELYSIENLHINDAPPIVEYKYNCSPFLHDSTIYTIENITQLKEQELQSDINCINTYLKLDFELNRQRLFNELINLSYITEYKPEKYSGVKLRYKISKQPTKTLGLCECSSKCTCNNITFLIFQSGNIIVTGFKSLGEIQYIIDDFNSLILSIKNTVRMKTFKTT